MRENVLEISAYLWSQGKARSRGHVLNFCKLLLAFGKLVAGNLSSDISVSWGGTQIEAERRQTAPSSVCVKVLCTHFFYNVRPALHTRHQRSSEEMIPRL